MAEFSLHFKGQFFHQSPFAVSVAVFVLKREKNSADGLQCTEAMAY